MHKRIVDALLRPIKSMPATTADRQMLGALVDALRRGHLAMLALMPGLTTAVAHRALIGLPRPPATLRPRQRRITRRRHAAVPRVAATELVKSVETVCA
jgi:hypothetical protein